MNSDGSEAIWKLIAVSYSAATAFQITFRTLNCMLYWCDRVSTPRPVSVLN